MTLEVKGAREVIAALGKLDPAAKRAFDKALREAASELVGTARSLVDPQGLSGWKKWRGGYEPSRIASGIKVKRGGSRQKGRVTQNFISVANTSAAGAIWEVAGRKSGGKPPGPGVPRKGNGRALVAAMNSRGGSASRTIWAAAEQTDMGGLERRIGMEIDNAARTVQQLINRT